MLYRMSMMKIWAMIMNRAVHARYGTIRPPFPLLMITRSAISFEFICYPNLMVLYTRKERIYLLLQDELRKIVMIILIVKKVHILFEQMINRKSAIISNHKIFTFFF